MKRLIIICEGPTEKEFCKDVLSEHFLAKDINLECPTIKHSNGGIVPWSILKKQIIRHLNEGDCIVSLLIDYYRIRDSYSFPVRKSQIYTIGCTSYSTACYLT